MTIKAINVRNQFKGTVKEILEGPVLSEIDVQTASGIVTSVITTRSVKELELVVGSEVIAFVKSTEVSIAKLLTRDEAVSVWAERAAGTIPGTHRTPAFLPPPCAG